MGSVEKAEGGGGSEGISESQEDALSLSNLMASKTVLHLIYENACLEPTVRFNIPGVFKMIWNTVSEFKFELYGEAFTCISCCVCYKLQYTSQWNCTMEAWSMYIKDFSDAP